MAFGSLPALPKWSSCQVGKQVTVFSGETIAGVVGKAESDAG